MKLARVVGTAVATQKDPKLGARKLLVINPIGVDGTPSKEHLVAVDTVGAGLGEVILYVTGSSARMTELTKDAPVDAAIVAIVEEVEVEGKTTYKKTSGWQGG